ncbi:MAG TPA: hypothetical protein PKD26_03925 [Pyrinomonadaceae bacterium]|nr:hypothetical protein [Pyrinomonadaceae bacterium]
MKQNSSVFPLHPLCLSFHVVLALIVGLFFGSLSAAGAQETLENKVPKHLPIKVEVLYGKRAQTLENAEVKITKTGKRPIYSLRIFVSTVDDPRFAKWGVASFYFGRAELRTFGNLANSDDPFIKPGETVVFWVGKKSAEDFRLAIQNAIGIIPEKYELIFQHLGFGDGTSFWGTTGAYYRPKKETPIVNATDLRRPFFFRTAN